MKYILVRVFAYLILIILSILLIESFLQIHFFIKNGHALWQGHKNFVVNYVEKTNDQRFYRLKPNYEDENIKININGFRGPLVQSNKKLICIIGDSVPYGAGVKNEQTFPYILNRKIKERNIPFEVINAGVPSYNLSQSIEAWRISLKNYNCKVVIINAANDVSLIDFYGENWNLTSNWADARFNIKKQYRSAFKFYVLDGLSRKNKKMDANNLNNALDIIAKNTKNGLDEITNKNQKVIIMPIQPCFYKNKPYESISTKKACKGFSGYIELAKNWTPIINALNSKLYDLSKFDKVFFFDTNLFLEKSLIREDSFVDFIHYSPTGNEVIAGNLLKFMESHNFFDQK